MKTKGANAVDLDSPCSSCCAPRWNDAAAVALSCRIPTKGVGQDEAGHAIGIGDIVFVGRGALGSVEAVERGVVPRFVVCVSKDNTITSSSVRFHRHAYRDSRR